MDDLIARLEDETRAYILAAMPPDPSGRLAAESLSDLLISYGTWRSRLVPARPRRVHLSAELQASPKVAEHNAALDVIVAKIEAGDDLGPHLSKAVECDRGRDRMLADFGVHHLHLATTLEPGGRYVTRGNDLLFASFKADDAYLIGIYQHITDWAREDILTTVARNWPRAGIVHKLKSVIGLEQQFNDADRLALQRAGIAAGAVEVDGKVYMTVGQSLAGTPYSASRLMMVVMHTFREWRENLDERLADAATAANDAAGVEVAGEWTPAIHDECAGLLREDVFCRIVSLR